MFISRPLRVRSRWRLSITVKHVRSRRRDVFYSVWKRRQPGFPYTPPRESHWSARTRRYLMKVFPYLVVSRIEKDAVWIIGVVHEKRDPKNWRHLL